MANRNRRNSCYLTILTISAMAGCSTQQPLISHAHVGHALTTWHDTPEQRGLMEVAAADLDIAEQEARLACAEPQTQTTARHAANVVNALVPEAQPIGPASGYGAARALMGTVEHLEYAATSADASLNLVTAVANLSVHGESVHALLEVATDLAQALVTASPPELADTCARLQKELRVAIHGGVVGPDEGGFSTIGFNAFHLEVLATLDREREPVYEPVPRRYVLGLVRLPTGQWRYQLPRSGQQSSIYYGY